MRDGITKLFILLFTGLLNKAAAQQHIFQNYTVNDGLVANNIRSIFQDSQGFVWIATWEGLSKYDGHKFTNYNISNGLSHNVVNDLYESADGKLYVALNDGSIDIIKENRIIGKTSPGTTIVNKFLITPQGRVIVTTDHEGVQEFRDGRFIIPRQDFPTTSYHDIAILNDSLFIVSSDSSIRLLNSQFETISSISANTRLYVETKVYQDSKSRMWLGNSLGLKLFAGIPQKNQPITFANLPPAFNIPALTNTKINDLYEDADNIFWIATSMGLVKINKDGSHQIFTKRNGLPTDIITYIFQDREMNIWVGTALGVSKLVTKSRINLYTTDDGLFDDMLYYSLPFKKDHLLASTHKGIQTFNSTTGKFFPATKINNQVFTGFIANSDPLLLWGSDHIIALDSSSSGNHKTIPFPFWSTALYNMVMDKNNYFFSNDQHNLYFSPGKKEQTDTVLNYTISGLLMSKKGDLWVGTRDSGLYKIRYQYSDNKLRVLEKKHLLPKESIRSLFEDSKNNLWVGTRYQGVYKLVEDAKGNFSVSNFDQKNGLTSNWVKSMTEDASGNLWIASNQGLDKLDMQDNSYSIFNFSRVNNQFANISQVVSDGVHSIWLVTDEGLVHIIDGEMEKLPPLPVYITKVFSPDSIYSSQTGKLYLSYRRNQLQFEFSSPGFINERQVLYSYRLADDENTPWSDAENQHSVSYAKLRPGHYKFEVRSKGWNGEWGKPAVFEFIIKPPFWQTWWFITLSALLISAIVYSLFRKRISDLRRESAMKQKIAETEMMALRAQMNPHFIFNCINSIDALIQSNDKYNATMYLNKFAKLIRNILDSSKMNTVTLAKDLDTIKLYIELEQLRHENKFIAEILADDALLQDDYKVPPLIVQPFIENAILHGIRYRHDNNGKLLVSVVKKDGYLEYIIEDNGVGRNTDKSHSQKEKLSYGIDMSNERVKLFNNEEKPSVRITDLFENEKPAGTRVEVQLKIQ